ncbi:conserved hypothetical protein [Pirellula staleyi DSM 6068]|uniref:DinB-like domain-containing protein n=1 Tax=Pirellula staleyi (strain ATCC 27377 / DSM 6068 / ICPB 4128) TaxID=530564 RepID=D2R5L8_PIRSD|nr:DinB family protein [Pirellula staleyi]ADB17200.1 conserved hypothetical protein [Pirellula staleyi DSM 6068]
MNAYAPLIDRYAAGPERLRELVIDLTPDELRARPIAGKWSTLEVVAHIADFEPIFLDRMKRVIAEEESPIRSGDENLFFQRLKYEHRQLACELALIEACRAHAVTILRNITDADFAREGIHSELGRVSLQGLLEKVTGHIEHHLPFIEEKRRALRGS